MSQQALDALGRIVVDLKQRCTFPAKDFGQEDSR